MNVKIQLFAAHAGKTTAEQRESSRKLLVFALDKTFGVSLSDLDIQKTPSGKPYAAGRGDIFFSLSHTPGFAVCAAGGVPVGVDVEGERTVPARVIERFLGGCPPGEALPRWTERESYGKMTGEGFFFALPKRPHILRSYFEKGCVITLCAGSGAGGFVPAYSELPEQVTWYEEQKPGER